MVKMCKMNFARVILLLKSQIVHFPALVTTTPGNKINEIIKGDGGVIDVFDHEEALLEWEVRGAAIADMFQDLPDIDKNDCYQFHYENTDNFERTFRNDSNKLFEDFLNNGNPFVECEQGLLYVVSKTVVIKESLKSVREALSIGIVEK